MFDFFRRRTAKELIEQANETYELPKPVKVPTMPTTTKPKQDQENYRIGVRPDGMTSITFMDHSGFSMTLSMNQAGCEQMIRMIRATYPEPVVDDLL